MGEYVGVVGGQRGRTADWGADPSCIVVPEVGQQADRQEDWTAVITDDNCPPIAPRLKVVYCYEAISRGLSWTGPGLRVWVFSGSTTGNLQEPTLSLSTTLSGNFDSPSYSFTQLSQIHTRTLWSLH